MPENHSSDANVRLTALNKRVADMEQSAASSDESLREASSFFRRILSDQLVFRRADGEVIGKSGPDGFLERLRKPGHFRHAPSRTLK
jgi:hypothetical protein